MDMPFNFSGLDSDQSVGEFGPQPTLLLFKDLVETIVETGKDLNLFATTAWAIWNRWNTMRTRGTHVPVQQVHYEVQEARSTFI